MSTTFGDISSKEATGFRGNSGESDSLRNTVARLDRNDRARVMDVNNFNAIRISLASPEAIRAWSYGEVVSPKRLTLEL